MLLKCPYEAPSRGYLANHMTRRHSKVKKYICEDCGYAAKQKTRLRDHRISFHKIGEKQHKCELCPYSFYLKGGLTKHINEVHKKIRKHKCGECGYAANAGNLRQHINAVHKKIKNFVCEECGFAASGKSNLNTHIKAVHKKVRDYVCEECEYTTSLKLNLKTHVKEVHGKKKSQDVNEQKELNQGEETVHKEDEQPPTKEKS